MYGIQTIRTKQVCGWVFENDVKMYGIQTISRSFTFSLLFENDVKMYGIQTSISRRYRTLRLRMM